MLLTGGDVGRLRSRGTEIQSVAQPSLPTTGWGARAPNQKCHQTSRAWLRCAAISDSFASWLPANDNVMRPTRSNLHLAVSPITVIGRQCSPHRCATIESTYRCRHQPLSDVSDHPPCDVMKQYAKQSAKAEPQLRRDMRINCCEHIIHLHG